MKVFNSPSEPEWSLLWPCDWDILKTSPVTFPAIASRHCESLRVKLCPWHSVAGTEFLERCDFSPLFGMFGFGPVWRLSSKIWLKQGLWDPVYSFTYKNHAHSDGQQTHLQMMVPSGHPGNRTKRKMSTTDEPPKKSWGEKASTSSTSCNVLYVT